MTISENINEKEEAICISNKSGRILTANKHFCKLFGFEQHEIKWHYLCDFYRGKNKFSETFEKTTENEEEVLQTKMRSRSGRSFYCILKRKIIESTEGIPILMNIFQRIDALGK